MKVDFPENSYVKKININDGHLDVEFAERKKVALLFISINQTYWPYLKQVIEDCRKNFLPQHKVDYFVWSDMPEVGSEEYTKILDNLLDQKNLSFLREKSGIWPNNQFFSKEVIKESIDFLRSQSDIFMSETEGVEWPAPTLMRYHLFLQQQDKLKDYDYIFYLDADMRVVSKVSDEVLGEGLTAAPHPGYAVNPMLIPPYEPNPASKAFIPRLGRLVQEGDKVRFVPFYAAGGFQGGKSDLFIAAMETMRENIDTDFNNNYTAIWNDESHWNKYLYDHQLKNGIITFLDVSYVYPDSLIEEYYVPKVWGKNYTPKIVTLTKPFSLSKQAADELREATGQPAAEKYQCPSCKENFDTTGYKVTKAGQCPGGGKPHQLDMVKV